MTTATFDPDLVELFLNGKKYVQTFMQVQDKRREVVPFVLNPLQSSLWDSIEKHNRVIIVKARQMGCSTAIIAYFLHQCLTVPNTIAVIVSHEERATQRLLDKAKFFYESIPTQVKPEIHHDSPYEKSWPDMNSTFYIGTARAFAFGRGDTIHLCHLSEPAFYPPDKADSIIKGISEAVPEDTGKLIEESTPNGRAGKFYETYQAAIHQENNFHPVFFPWWFDPTYKAPAGAVYVKESIRYDFELTEEETALLTKHDLTMEHVRWRKNKQASLREIFAQEYPENDVECWLVKGTSALPTESLLIMAKNIAKPYYEDEGIRCWRGKVPGHQYVMAVDCSKGLPTSDPSAAVVLDTKTLQHVCTIWGRFPTDVMAEKCHMVAGWYNNALIVPEMEGYGDAFVKFLRRMGYSKIYRSANGKLGWFTVARGQRDRNWMLEELRGVLRSHSLESWDELFINEALDFQWVDDKAQAPPKGHDDLVMAMAIAVSVLKSPRFETEERGAPISYIGASP